MVPAGFGYAVVEAGQFQVCVRAYIPPKECRMPGVNYDVAQETAEVPTTLSREHLAGHPAPT
jgi:hypothetical protein